MTTKMDQVAIQMQRLEIIQEMADLEQERDWETKKLKKGRIAKPSELEENMFLSGMFN